ncbi:MAG: TIGR01212 family radical SAM protein [Acidobacteriota bacterium]|nr:MAG: TIGR01212 family radical SAM protein [Acidobacteriota bacterium]
MRERIPRYNSYNRWLKAKFGERVYKVSVDGGFTCPNRDGTVAWGGCTYCNNDSFRPDEVAPEKSLRQQIKDGTEYLTRRFEAYKFIVYWQAYSNTYKPVDELEPLYRSALEADSRIVGMAIGTRPDCIDREKLQMILDVAGDRYICMEYGLESVFEETLKRINRGHDLFCYLEAVEETKSLGIDVCSHIILGFPGESREQLLSYADTLNDLGVDFVKIHHLHIVKGTRMAKEYLKEPFPLFTAEEWTQLVCDFLERLDPRIRVQRLFGWSPEEHLVGPKWGLTKPQLLTMIHEELERRDSRQGLRFLLEADQGGLQTP